MRTTSARVLKGLHEGYVLMVCVDRGGRNSDAYHLMSWKVEVVEGEAYLSAQSVAKAYQRPFSYAAADDLRMDGLLEWLPNTGTNALFALTREGLAVAQGIIGPVASRVLVKHEAGVETLSPAGCGGPTAPTGTIAVPDE